MLYAILSILISHILPRVFYAPRVLLYFSVKIAIKKPFKIYETMGAEKNKMNTST